MNQPLDLSVIIVSWNTKDLLQNCLNSVYAETKNISFEVFVVDNASSDGSAEMVDRELPQVHLIQNNQNLGFAKANNQAIRQSRGRYVLLLNPDTVVLDGALDKMVAFMETHHQAGVLTCKIFKPDGTVQPSARTHFGTLLGGTLLAHLRFIALMWVHRHFLRRQAPGNSLGGFLSNDNIIREVSWVLGACMMVRRETISQVGLLDEQLFLSGEEVDWCYRAKQKGWNIYFLPDARIIHYHGQSTRQASNVRVYSYQSMFKFAKKYRGKPYAICLRIVRLVDVSLRILLLSIHYLIPVRSNRSQIASKLRDWWQVFRLNIMSPEETKL